MVNGSAVLDEAVRLPDPPDGFYTLTQMVMTGHLQHAATIVSVCDTLWSGLVRWAEERSYTLVASQEIPFFFKKLIEEVLGFARFVHTPYAPGKRLSRWPSFDQAPQEGYAL